MDLHKSKHIIFANYRKEENSLIYLLNEECKFVISAFWEYYDAIAFVTRNSIKNEDLSAQIAISYQWFLKELIWNFAPNDITVINDLPENYIDYIERLDFAIRAYYEDKPEWLRDELFDLQR